jgi:branched-chain amino acid transport system substrate-binding protein
VCPLADRTFVYKVTPDARDVATQLVRLIGEHKHRQVALLAGAGMHGDSGVEAMTSRHRRRPAPDPGRPAAGYRQ